MWGCDVEHVRVNWSESVIDLCPSSPQEPSLDPKAILELPLERLAQKLQNDELSLESVLCSYLEEVAVGSGGGWGFSPIVLLTGGGIRI